MYALLPFFGLAAFTIRLHGPVGISPDGHPAMINPAYELLR